MRCSALLLHYSTQCKTPLLARYRDTVTEYRQLFCNFIRDITVGDDALLASSLSSSISVRRINFGAVSISQKRFDGIARTSADSA